MYIYIYTHYAAHVLVYIAIHIYIYIYDHYVVLLEMRASEIYTWSDIIYQRCVICITMSASPYVSVMVSISNTKRTSLRNICILCIVRYTVRSAHGYGITDKNAIYYKTAVYI